MTKIITVIQARLGSTRLPGKVLAGLCGEPMLWHIIERVKRATKIGHLILAVPPRDMLALEPIASRCGIEIMAPNVPENDLVARFHAVATATQADYLVRICADNPCVEPEEIDRIIEASQAADHGGPWSNMHDLPLPDDSRSGYPDGLGAEVYTAMQLTWMMDNVHVPAVHEHPHLFLEASDLMHTIPCPPAFARPEIRLDVNTAEDLHFIRGIYQALYPTHPNFHITDILALLDERNAACATPG